MLVSRTRYAYVMKTSLESPTLLLHQSFAVWQLYMQTEATNADNTLLFGSYMISCRYMIRLHPTLRAYVRHTVTGQSRRNETEELFELREVPRIRIAY